jgi:hypothetical protein
LGKALGLKTFTQNRKGNANFWWVEYFIRGVREILGVGFNPPNLPVNPPMVKWQ